MIADFLKKVNNDTMKSFGVPQLGKRKREKTEVKMAANFDISTIRKLAHFGWTNHGEK
jgi:hypothetical protein